MGQLDNTTINLGDVMLFQVIFEQTSTSQTAAEAAFQFHFSMYHEMTGPSSSYSSPYL